LSPEDERELAEALAEIERGEFVTPEQLNELLREFDDVGPSPHRSG
jgi:predicted transcriptional regulator